jgi:hypothetical protein
MKKEINLKEFDNETRIYPIPKKDKLKESILKSISKHLPVTLKEVRHIYDRLESYDKVIYHIEFCQSNGIDCMNV